jgi:hypothetical protein
MPINVGPLVVVTEEHHPLAQARPGFENAFIGAFIGKGVEGIEADWNGWHGGDKSDDGEMPGSSLPLAGGRSSGFDSIIRPRCPTSPSPTIDGRLK